MNARYRKHLSGELSYKSFIPLPIENYEWTMDDEIADRSKTLRHKFSKLNEKYLTTTDDGLRNIALVESADSWMLSEMKPYSSLASYCHAENKDVVAIADAMEYGMAALAELPICSRLLQDIHYIVCQSSNYDKKYRGELRKSPVWLGTEGCNLSDALFIPPVADDMINALSNLEKYINYSDDDIFIKTAITHYQFEMIHPFIDANGRMGRLLNYLQLYEAGILARPILLLSRTLSYSYNEYCEKIQMVNETSDISSWLRYYLKIMEMSANYTLMAMTQT